MNKIRKNDKINSYAQLGMKGKYIYMKRKNSECEMHYIFLIRSITNDSPVSYDTSKTFMLSIPNDKELKAYVYEDITNIQLNQSDDLFDLTRDEYINIFKEFVALEGAKSKNISLNFDVK